MPTFTLTIQDLPAAPGGLQVKLLTLEGQLDESNIEDNTPRVYELIDDGSGKKVLIFDLEKLTYLNSKAVGFMMDWNSRISKEGGYIVVINVPPNIKDIITAVGLTDFVKEYGTLSEAKNAIYQS